MKSKEYWNTRFIELEKAQNADAGKTYAEIEKAFDNSYREIEKEIYSWYGRLGQNNGVSIEEAKKLLSKGELEEFKWSVDEYVKYGKENALNQRWIKELENASAKHHINRLESLKIHTRASYEKLYGLEDVKVTELVKNAYSNEFYKTAFEVQKGMGVGFDIGKIDESKLSKIVSKPWAVDGANFSDRIWKNKEKLVNELHQNLTQNVLLGQGPDKVISKLQKDFKVSRSNTSRLVMTESAYFSSLGEMDSLKNLGVERYEILATLDSSTSEICQSLDGKVFDVKDYEIGATAPPFHVNCRSTTVPYYEDLEGEIEGERIARGKDGENYYVPESMNYEEWKKGFVDGDKSGIIKEEHIRNLKDNPTEAYKQAVKAEPKITEDIVDTADMVGAKVEGLEFRLKTEESYERKILQNPKAEIRDIIRYTYVFDSDGYLEGINDSISALEQKGYKTIKVKNYWNDRENPYNGVNTFVENNKGQVFELQYHTQESFDLKNGKLHELYEIQRVITDMESDEFSRLSDEMMELSNKLQVPNNIKELKSYGK